MIPADRVLQGNLTDVGPKTRERGRELETLGLCQVVETEYVYCIHPEDGDYDRVYDRNCDASIVLDGDEDRYIRCPECGREVLLPAKTRRTQTDIERSEEGIYNHVSDLVREALDTRAQKKDSGLKYLDHRVEPVLDASYEADPVSFQFVFESPRLGVIDAMRVFDRNAVTILVGTATNTRSEFEDRNLAHLTLSDLVDSDRDEALREISDVATRVIERDRLSDAELKATLSERIYTEEREELSWREFWREFEHCVQNILVYTFTTSRLLGGEESGKQVPDGVLTLNWDGTGQAYIWDAKYVAPSNVPRDLSGDYEDIAKHLVQFRRESNVRDVFDDVAGFLLVSPGIKDSSVVRLAERIQQRLEETGEQWGGPVVHVRFDALLRLLRRFRENGERVQEKPRELRRHTHRLFRNPDYHTDEPESYREADVRVFDVDSEDIDRTIRERIAPQKPEEDEINIEGYLANIDSLDF